MENLAENLEKIQLLGVRTDRRRLAPFLPDTPGIYIFSKDNTPIYIGKAINLKRRVISYFDLNLEQKTRAMVSSAESLSFIKVTSELEALLLEARLIRKYMPQYNIVAKDDKHPLYIIITKEKYPRVISARRLSTDSQKPLASFGPFPSAGNVRLVMKMVRRIFPFSDHKIGKRGCLASHIGLCKPCPSEIEQLPDENLKIIKRKEYLKNIRRIRAVLSGKFIGIKEELEVEMKALSLNQNYEGAAKIRDQIQKLDYITAPQMQTEFFMENPNLYSDLRLKEMRELKKTVQKFGIYVPDTLKRIECFDIAHLAGTEPTASMVTFINAEADKKYYRHFRIRQEKGNSDVDSLREVIKRRLNHLEDWGKPDLFVVDGGKPQVATFVRELENSGIPLVGIAKKLETLVFPVKLDGTLSFKEYKLPRGAALNLIQRMRDEAHRFARVYHHKLISKSFK